MSEPPKTTARTNGHPVLTLRDCDRGELEALLGRFGLVLEAVAAGQPIPGSFWGDEEAGLIGDRLLARPDTPIHSILHEACHYICMDPARRNWLDTNAGGDYDEENGVCYLQILLAGELAGMGRDRMLRDMDAWGYSFRLGSAQAWFENDAGDALAWLQAHQLVDSASRPRWTVRVD